MLRSASRCARRFSTKNYPTFLPCFTVVALRRGLHFSLGTPLTRHRGKLQIRVASRAPPLQLLTGRPHRVQRTLDFQWNRSLLSSTAGVGDGGDEKDAQPDAGKREQGSGSAAHVARKAQDTDYDQEGPVKKHPKALIGQARRIMELARPEGALIAGGMGLLFGTTAISLAVPKVMGELIDTVVQSTGTYTPWEAAGILMALFGSQSVMLAARSSLMAVAGERVSMRLRSLAFGSMVVQETAFFDRNRTGDLVNRLASDVLLVQGSVTTSAAQGLRNVLMVVGCTGMLAYLSPQLAIVSVSIFPPMAGIGVWFGRKMKKQQKGVQAALAASSAVAEEALSNIRTVRQFSAEMREKDRYTGKVKESYYLAAKVGVTNAVFEGSMHFGGHASLCAVMALGGQQVASGQLSVGDMTSFLLYSTFLAVNFGGLTGVYSQIMRALGASERVMAIISSAEAPQPAHDSDPTVRIGPDLVGTEPGHQRQNYNLEIAGGASLGENVAGRVVFKDVYFSYPTRPHAQVLGGMTVEVEAGSSLAIVGASGCGKSTVLRLLTRMYDPQAGSIELDGIPLHTLEPRGLRDRVGVVEQEPVLFGGSIGDNIRYGRPDATLEEVEAAASVANASGFIKSFPQGYDTQVGEGGVQMSGGQKQRIAIARAVLKDPAIMLLDEATSALDSESEHLVQAALERVTKGRTSLIVAHRLSTVKSMADNICVLNKGQVVEMGTYDDLANRPDGHFRRLVQYQMLA